MTSLDLGHRTGAGTLQARPKWGLLRYFVWNHAVCQGISEPRSPFAVAIRSHGAIGWQMFDVHVLSCATTVWTDIVLDRSSETSVVTGKSFTHQVIKVVDT